MEGDWRSNLSKLYLDATKAMDKWFLEWWKPSGYYKRIEVPKTVIHVCGSEKLIGPIFKDIYGYDLKLIGIGGLKTYHKASNTFHVFIVSEKLINPVTLGHEMTHVLNHLDKETVNPDLLNKDSGYN